MTSEDHDDNHMELNGSSIDYEVVDARRYLCGICEIEHPISKAFRVNGCNHFFCSDCVSCYVDSSLQDNITDIGCPEILCKVNLEPQNCSSILSRHVFDKWASVLSTQRRAICDICEDEYPMSMGFHVNGCDHSFCSGCVAWYVAYSVHDNIGNIKCPKIGCEVKLDPQHYSSLLPTKVFDRLTVCSDFVFQCDICVNEKPLSSVFRITGCTHIYCSDCVAKYVSFKLRENAFTSIKCPNAGCKQILEPRHCKSILSSKVIDKWGDILCEASILCSEKLYCPYRNCSSLLINDCDNVATQSECPHCQRLLCAQCNAPWHMDMSCELHQKLHTDERKEEDMMLLELAKDNEWKRCPNCGFVVEKFAGCSTMVCRCKCTFCYECGAEMKDHSGVCFPMFEQVLDHRDHPLLLPQVLNEADTQNMEGHPRFPQLVNGGTLQNGADQLLNREMARELLRNLELRQQIQQVHLQNLWGRSPTNPTRS